MATTTSAVIAAATAAAATIKMTVQEVEQDTASLRQLLAANAGAEVAAKAARVAKIAAVAWLLASAMLVTTMTVDWEWGLELVVAAATVEVLTVQARA